MNKLYADAGLFDSKDLTNAELVAKITALPLAEQPGTIWDYGHSTDVLGRIIEVISGKSLLAFAKERLLDPLGMKDTAFYVADPAKWPRIAEPMPQDRAISPMTQVRDPRKPLRWESGGGGSSAPSATMRASRRCYSTAAPSRDDAISSLKRSP